jgi:hypothetical protein
MSATRRAVCGRCKAPVIFARQSDGSIVVLERCREGEGNVAVQLPLLQGGRAEVVSVRAAVRTSYRRHIDTCPAADYYRNRWKSQSSDEFARAQQRRALQREIDRRALEDTPERDPAADLADKIVERLGGGRAEVSVLEGDTASCPH